MDDSITSTQQLILFHLTMGENDWGVGPLVLKLRLARLKLPSLSRNLFFSFFFLFLSIFEQSKIEGEGERLECEGVTIKTDSGGAVSSIDPGREQCQVGSLAGAAHLLNGNAGVLRWAQWEQKSHVEQKGKSSLDFGFSVRIQTAKAWPIDPLAHAIWMGWLSQGKSFQLKGVWEFQARGVRKVTTGITGLWRPSVHSDVAFWSFDVGSSYHCEAEFAKCWIVHPSKGNVSWV